MTHPEPTPDPGSPCKAHKEAGFVYSVIGCPRCYPATGTATCVCGATPPKRPWSTSFAPCLDGNGNFNPGHRYIDPAKPTPESVPGTLAELREFVDRETRQGSLSRSIGGAIISRIERIAATPQADRGDGLREAVRAYLDWHDSPRRSYRNDGEGAMVLEGLRGALILRDTAPSGLDVETLRKALNGFLTERGEYRGITPERLAAEYSWVAARLRESADQEPGS